MRDNCISALCFVMVRGGWLQIYLCKSVDT
jgi:hypothetical protein